MNIWGSYRFQPTFGIFQPAGYNFQLSQPMVQVPALQ